MLNTIQQQFEAALFDNSNKEIPFVASNLSAKRLNIYRQTVIENLRSALEITYPGIWQLLGKECADNVARLYCSNQENLPKSACLDDWGQDFSSIFELIPALCSLEYLKDYANYEWKKQLAMNADKSEPLTIDSLKKIKIESYENIQFSFHPSVHLLYSRFPLYAIEKLIEDSGIFSVDLRQGECFAYLVRLNAQVFTFWLSKEEWEFVKYLKEGNSLKTAFSLVSNKSQLNLTKNLCFIFETKSITAIEDRDR